MITQKKIKELNFSDQIYFIPSYQRGYRWDEKQVTELLEDIYEVFKTEQKSYCLQPIVVNTIIKDKQFEIIDGQQRLTTIFIILLRLARYSDERFMLDFETRPECVTFFNELPKENYDYTNPDFAHISDAYKVVSAWFQEKKDKKIDSNIEMNVFQTLLEKIEVIWYDVEISDREDSIKIFTRLNSGKIPLTTAELLKALFLSKANFSDAESYYKDQLDLSNKWNQIEYKLQDDEFWSFINEKENDTPTRIEYIFALQIENEGIEINEKDDIFRYYYPFYVKNIQDKSKNFVKDKWVEIELLYTILHDWYSDNQLYHLIGLLIWDGADINNLIEWYKTLNKTDFKFKLFEEIYIRFYDNNLSSITYKHYENVYRVLVFFNVMESYVAKTSRFPFKNIKDENIKWSLEHIHAQNSEKINQNQYKQWLEDHRKVVKIINSKNDYDQDLRNLDNLLAELEVKRAVELKDEFSNVSVRILNILSLKEEHSTNEAPFTKIPYEVLSNEHHISNMALLDTRSNSSLGNSAFAVKRKAVINMDLNGVFIPLATKNSFLKYYSDYPEHLNYWTLDDRDEYLGKIMKQFNFVKNEAEKLKK